MSEIEHIPAEDPEEVKQRDGVQPDYIRGRGADNWRDDPDSGKGNYGRTSNPLPSSDNNKQRGQ